MHGDGERFGRWEPLSELAVDQQCPYITEGHPLGDQILDVDTAIAQ
ncbi:Uncharacterised protein [Mycobacteroides abscessus subsp. abscessus]|nr:Uncharacterised protein [Mycobacteroides abscessus subsp. abscessus]